MKNYTGSINEIPVLLIKSMSIQCLNVGFMLDLSKLLLKVEPSPCGPWNHQTTALPVNTGLTPCPSAGLSGRGADMTEELLSVEGEE